MTVMKPLIHPRLVNDPFGDPGLYVELLFEHRALLFDLGDIRALAPRQLLRVSDVFVSHTHMDHFIGFDHLLRILLGRERNVRLYGPRGFIAQVEHHLGGYTWNLVGNYTGELVFEVTEILDSTTARHARFACRSGFRREADAEVKLSGGILRAEDAIEVSCTLLDHGTPSLAFRLAETTHLNVWKDRLQALGLPTGGWLRDLKAAVRAGAPPETPITIRWHEDGAPREVSHTLGWLRDTLLHEAPGQTLAYVADCAATDVNAGRIVALARSADWLCIECTFLEEDRDHAARKFHLTAADAGRLAREAGVKRIIPFHFSPKYEARPEALEAELYAAFLGAAEG